MRSEYETWLRSQKYAENTCGAQVYRVKKVEEFYGSLDDAIASGEIDAIIAEMVYSTEDERRDKPNPSKLPFQGNIRNNLAAYRNAAQRYLRFAEGDDSVEVQEEAPTLGNSELEPAEKTQKLALERDMQKALRRNIKSLEVGLKIVDEGAEMSVDTGFIDILCEDSRGAAVVVELKAGKSDARVVGQTLGYMGDLMAEDAGRPVRGIIVAHEFDKRTKASARVIPNLLLKSYSISFLFEDVE